MELVKRLKQKTLERITFIAGRLVDSKGHIVNAKPVSELDLFFMNRVTQDPEEVILGRAPTDADYYMKSRHSFNSMVGYPSLNQERVPNAPELEICAVQYWKRK